MIILYLSHPATDLVTPVFPETVELIRALIDEDTPQQTDFTSIAGLMPEATARQVNTVIQLIRTRVNLQDYDTAQNLSLWIVIMENGQAGFIYEDLRDHIEFSLRFEPNTETWDIVERRSPELPGQPPPRFPSLDEALGYLADRDPKINNSLMRRRRSPRRF